MESLRSIHVTGVGLILLLLGACVSTPLPELPAEDVPVAWERATPAADLWPSLDWWNNFESDELRSVIALVEERNFDLGNNERNLRLAQLALRDAGFDLLPTPVVEIGGSGNYFGVKPADGGYTDSTTESANLTFGFVYSDILSKPAQYDIAKARYDLSIAAIADTRLNTLGTAASTYFRILLLRERIDAAKQNLANAEAIARIVEARVAAGTVNKIDLLQQQIAAQRQSNELSSLMQDELGARSALALLVAESVQDFNIVAVTLEDVLVPDVEPGLPSSLLTRRPDIAQAEANLRVSRASVDLARTAYLPNIILTGSASLRSDSLDDLFSDPITTTSVTGSIFQLLLDNGSRRRDLEARQLQLESGLANYRETVIAAFNDIEVSIGNIELLAALGVVAIRDLARAEEAFRISEVRYREGVANFQEVLVSQSALYNARNSLSDNKLAQLNAIIAFYQSLGGGWQKG
jgi:NodT family efflux transporter outer membrane factor (OMF) lipoprotein